MQNRLNGFILCVAVSQIRWVAFKSLITLRIILIMVNKFQKIPMNT